MLGILLLLNAATRATEITEKGRKLAEVLDRMGVEKLWKQGNYVNWDTGESLDKEVTDGKPHTHCSAFAASAAKKLGVYLLRPPGKDDPPGVKGHREKLLANAQFDWLHSCEGYAFGWRPVSSPLEAQRLANRGYLVVATFGEANPKKSGHIAIVRPSSQRSEEEIEADGPQVIQAGMRNRASTTLRAGFGSHKEAWEDGRGVRFFAHPLDLP
jgi:hypothetical protein